MIKDRLQVNDETPLLILFSLWLIPWSEGGAGDAPILSKREFCAGSRPGALQIPHKETAQRNRRDTGELIILLLPDENTKLLADFR